MMTLFGKRHNPQSSNDEIRQRIRESMRHGHLNMGSYSDDVDVKLWLPEMNGINVTVFLDRLLENNEVPHGSFFLVTDKGDFLWSIYPFLPNNVLPVCSHEDSVQLH